MISNRVKNALGLAVLCSALALGLAACGGDEPAPVVQPPPPPAPPPFQPQPVEVALGASGDSVTLMTKEGGGFTLEGEDFEGGTLAAENGNEYELALADGEWAATYVAATAEIVIGASGETVTVTKAEDGTYFLGDAALESGGSYTAANGNMYALTMGEDGAWSAAYVPVEVEVALGGSGEGVTLTRAEDGSYWIGEAAIESGGTHAAANGNDYTLTMDGSGAWSAAYNAVMQTVALGASGDSVTLMTKEGGGFTLEGEDFEGGTLAAGNGNEYELALADGEWAATYVAATAEIVIGASGETVTVTKAEDGTYFLGDAALESGGSYTAANGNMYALTMGEDGAWSAAYVPVEVEVALGGSGEGVTLTRAEDGSYWIGEAAIESGGTHAAANGNDYTLTMDGSGAWSAAYVPVEVEVALGGSGEGVTLTRAEDGSYWIGEAAIESGGTHAAANGNDYTLTMDGSGAWSAAYVPVEVEVALGGSGEGVTLTRAEDGSYWIGEAAIESGGTHAAANGNDYTLTMDGSGAWSAAYVPVEVEVALGGSGEGVTLTRAEDGSYWIGEAAIESGGTHAAANGNDYTLTMDGSGAWSAAYNVVMQTVALGASGSVELTRLEDGTWTLAGMPVASGSTTTVGANTYALALDAGGAWSAAYVPAQVEVPLGISGETAVLTRAEDGSHSRGGEPFASGGMVTTMNGNVYTLALDATGAWAASYNPVMQTVALGPSGTIDLVRVEDGSWTKGGAAFASGGSHVADNGNVYTLTLAGGGWGAEYVPETMAIAGTGLTASAKEDGSGYDVTSDMYDGTASLGTNGAGDVTLGGAMFHVNMDEDGNLEGARFALPIESSVLYENLEGTSGAPSLSGDDRSTPDVDEAGVTLTAAGTDFSAGALLSSGTADAQGGRFVGAALAEMIKLRNQVAVLVDLFNDGGLERSALTAQLLTKWTQATTVVNKVFADDHTLDEDTNPRRVVAAFDEVVDALSSEEAFIAATAADSDNVFDAAELSAANAAKAYARVEWEATAVLGQLGDTRFGAAVRGNRNHAEQGAATATEQTQAFAYATIEGTRRASDVQLSGSAYYEGVTHAVDKANTPNLYVGDVELQVRFTRSSVSGMVSNLETVGGGEAWSHGLGGAVDRIFLPDASLRRTGAWSGSGDARLSYVASAGGARDLPVEDVGEFDGRLLGRGDEAGEQAIGTWKIGDLLAGGFGAQRVADRADPLEPFLDDVTTPGTQYPAKNTRPAAVHDANLRFYYNANSPNENRLSDESDTGDEYLDVQFNLKLATLFGDGYPIEVGDADSDIGQQEWLSGTHRAAALEELSRLRNTLQKWIAFDDADASEDDRALALDERRKTLDAIVMKIDEELFGAINGATEGATTGAEDAMPGDENGPGWLIFEVAEAFDFNTDADDDPATTTEDVVTEYPGTAARPNDAQVLSRLDAVIEALSDADAFADAFDRGGIFEGVYTLTDDTTDTIDEDDYVKLAFDQGLSPDQIWNKAKTRLSLWTERTDYTRFGGWLKFFSAYASDNSLADEDNPDFMSEGSYHYTEGTGPYTEEDPRGEWDAFVYSPLEAAAYSTISAQGYPGGQSATYVGETVAVQRETFYTGRIEARISWDSDAVGGDLRVSIIDLTSTDPEYGLIQHGNPAHPTNPTVADVRRLTFNVTVNENLEFVNALDNPNVAGAKELIYEVEYDTLGGGEPTGDAAPSFGNPPGTEGGKIIDKLPLGSVAGRFVGQDPDGPLAVIGRWTIIGSERCRSCVDDRPGLMFLGVGDNRAPIYGAFGADIAP